MALYLSVTSICMEYCCMMILRHFELAETAHTLTNIVLPSDPITEQHNSPHSTTHGNYLKTHQHHCTSATVSQHIAHMAGQKVYVLIDASGCSHKSTHVDQPHSSVALLFGKRQPAWSLLLKDVALAKYLRVVVIITYRYQ